MHLCFKAFGPGSNSPRGQRDSRLMAWLIQLLHAASNPRPSMPTPKGANLQAAEPELKVLVGLAGQVQGALRSLLLRHIHQGEASCRGLHPPGSGSAGWGQPIRMLPSYLTCFDRVFVRPVLHQLNLAHRGWFWKAAGQLCDGPRFRGCPILQASINGQTGYQILPEPTKAAANTLACRTRANCKPELQILDRSVRACDVWGAHSSHQVLREGAH